MYLSSLLPGFNNQKQCARPISAELSLLTIRTGRRRKGESAGVPSS